MLNQAQVGVQNSSDGVNIIVRAGKQGDAIVSELHGSRYEGAYRGNRFSVANQAAVTTTAGLATTFTGLVVGNPTGSGYNLVFEKFAAAQFAVGAAGAIGLMGAASGANPITNTLTILNRKMGGAASIAAASAGQTISTPLLLDVFGSVGSLATTGYGIEPGIYIDMAGDLIVPPGYFVASFTSIVTTSALLFKFGWEEVPI